MLKSNRWKERDIERGPNSRIEVKVELEDLFHGAKKTITVEKKVVCHFCHGLGSNLDHKAKCAYCQGRGSTIEHDSGGPTAFGLSVGGLFGGQSRRSKCQKCNGRGFVIF